MQFDLWIIAKGDDVCRFDFRRIAKGEVCGKVSCSCSYFLRNPQIFGRIDLQKEVLIVIAVHDDDKKAWIHRYGVSFQKI